MNGWVCIQKKFEVLCSKNKLWNKNIYIFYEHMNRHKTLVPGSDKVLARGPGFHTDWVS